ncbi:DUF6603 domain-containing protein, partial [Streptomyces lavendulae]
GVGAGLSDVPMLAGTLSSGADLRLVRVRGLVAPASVSAALLGRANDLVTAAGVPLPFFPVVDPRTGGLPRGGWLVLDLSVPGQPEASLSFHLGGGGPAALEAAGAPVAWTSAPGTAPPASQVPGAWADLGLSLGPLRVWRVGLGYERGTLWLMVDAALSAAGLTISVAGLGVGIDLGQGAGFAPRFRLQGLGVAFDRPPLLVAGALV